MEKKLSYQKEHQFPGSIFFKYQGEITEDNAMKMQEEAGYHPSGYGFYGFIHINNSTRWNCSNSCD